MKSHIVFEQLSIANKKGELGRPHNLGAIYTVQEGAESFFDESNSHVSALYLIKETIEEKQNAFIRFEENTKAVFIGENDGMRLELITTCCLISKDKNFDRGMAAVWTAVIVHNNIPVDPDDSELYISAARLALHVHRERLPIPKSVTIRTNEDGEKIPCGEWETNEEVLFRLMEKADIPTSATIN